MPRLTKRPMGENGKSRNKAIHLWLIDFFDKGAKTIKWGWGGENSLITNGTRTTGYNMKLDPPLQTIYKNYSKWLEDLKVEAKTIT